MSLGAKRIRLKINVATRQVRVDEVTNAEPHQWNGTPCQFELGFFFGEDTVESVSNLASIKLQGKPIENRRRPANFTNTIAASEFDNTLTAETWADGTKQHVVIPFTATQMTQIAGNKAVTKKFWCVISGLTTDNPALEPTFAYFELTLEEDGNGSVSIPALPLDQWYTRTEADARYLMRSEVGLETRWSDGKFYIQNVDNPTYFHALRARGEPANPQIELAPGEIL